MSSYATRVSPGLGDRQRSKQAGGLDSGQAATSTSWHRWTPIVLLVCAFLVCAFLVVAAAWQPSPDSNAAQGLIWITIAELLRQLRGTGLPSPPRPAAPRRRYQYRAQQAHQRARIRRELP